MVVAWGLVIVFGLDDAVTAMLGLAIIAATVPLARLAFSLAQRLPWPIYLVADLMVKAVEDVINATVTWSDAAAQGLADVIQLPWQAIWTVERATISSLEALYWSVWRVYYLEVPHIFGWAQAAIAGAEAAAFAHADQLAHNLVLYVMTSTASAIAHADQLWVSAITHADQLAVAGEQYAQALALDAIAHADQEFAEAIAHADAVGQLVAGYAATLATDVLEQVTAAEAALGLQLERVEQASTDYTQQVAGDLVQDIAAAQAAAEAYALAIGEAIGARVQDIEDSPCQRFCSPLGDLGGLLQGLEDLGVAALLVALLAEALEDPGAVEQALESVAAPIVKDVAGAFQLGIAS